MYTYPEALNALQSIATDYMKLLRPDRRTNVNLIADANAVTASVTWDSLGASIHLPVRPAASLMTQSEFEDWTAYLLHEMGHPTHTDWNTWTSAVKAGLGMLTNAVEDVRMEQALIASGIVPNAKRVLSRLISRKVSEARAKGWKPNARKEIGWTLCVLGRVANGYDIDATDVAWLHGQIIPGSTVHAILKWALPDMAKCSDTADCLALARRIAAAIAAPAGKPAGKPGDTSKPGQASQASQTSNAPSEPAQGDSEGEGEGEGGEGEGKGKDGHGHGNGSTSREAIDMDEAPVKSEDGLAKHDLAPQGDRLKGSDAAKEVVVITILRDSAMTAQPSQHMEGNRGAGHVSPRSNRLRAAAAKASKQRALLARALRANETEDREGGRRAGRLDRGALCRATAGAPNVFAKRDIAEGFDTDVHVLIDASGSMCDRMDAALEAGLVVAQAAASVGASCTTEVFQSAGYVRANGVGSKRQPSAESFASLNGCVGGCTPLSVHMARAATSQAKRAPHKRRVVFVITDGECDYGTGTVKRMVDYLEKTQGTVFAHVSIVNPLSGAFKAEVQVKPGQAMADIGLDHFVKVLQAL